MSVPVDPIAVALSVARVLETLGVANHASVQPPTSQIRIGAALRMIVDTDGRSIVQSR